MEAIKARKIIKSNKLINKKKVKKLLILLKIIKKH